MIRYPFLTALLLSKMLLAYDLPFTFLGCDEPGGKYKVDLSAVNNAVAILTENSTFIGETDVVVNNAENVQFTWKAKGTLDEFKVKGQRNFKALTLSQGLPLLWGGLKINPKTLEGRLTIGEAENVVRLNCFTAEPELDK